MELHPDRNTSASANHETQLLNEAYQVLSDEVRRREYDTTCLHRHNNSKHHTADVSANAEQTTRESSREQPNKPVSCSRCKAVTLQPRYRELITTVSYLVGSHKVRWRGIFCVACERKYSALATGLTSLFGWWSVHGFFWSIEALYKNLTGSWRFTPEDAMLSCAQALYFADKDMDLAHAVAVDALKLAEKSSKEQRKSSDKPEDKMQEIRSVMADLIKQTERAGFTKKLVRQPRLRQSSFIIQASFVCSLFIAAALIGFDIRSESERDKVERVRAEQTRLEHEGFARQQAQAVAAHQAEELRKLEQPIPPSGLFSSSLPRSRFYSAIGLPGLRVRAPAGANYYLKLSDWASKNAALTLFVVGGDTVDVDIPLGTYRISMAAGTTWYGEAIRFGPDTTYSQIDQPLTFSVEGDQLVGHEINLSQVHNGNLHPSPIKPNQF